MFYGWNNKIICLSGYIYINTYMLTYVIYNSINKSKFITKYRVWLLYAYFCYYTIDIILMIVYIFDTCLSLLYFWCMIMCMYWFIAKCLSLGMEHIIRKLGILRSDLVLYHNKLLNKHMSFFNFYYVNGLDLLNMR